MAGRADAQPWRHAARRWFRACLRGTPTAPTRLRRRAVLVRCAPAGAPGQPGALCSATVTSSRPLLEALGVITGYHAVVDLAKASYPVLAVVRLKYPGNHHQPLRRLLAERREIVERLRTTGDDCYALKVAATSLEHLEKLADELAGFGNTTTSVVYSQTLPYRGPGRP